MHLTNRTSHPVRVARAMALALFFPLTASACMTSPVYTIREDASLDDCTDLMESKKVRRVPVVASSGALVGIVAQADVARHASRKEAGELVRDVSAPGR